MKTLYYEIKKAVNPAFAFTLIAVMLLFNAVNIFKTYAPRPGSIDDKLILRGKTGIYDLLEGELTEEKYNRFYDKFAEVSAVVESGDFSTEVPDFEKYYGGFAFLEKYLYMEVSEELERQLSYNQKMKQLEAEAKKNAAVYENANEYNYRQNKLIEQRYSERYINSFYYTPPIINLFTYSFSSVLILMCMLLIITPLFSGERENDMLAVLKSTKRGCVRSGVPLDKIKSVILYITILIALFSACDFICLKLSLKFTGMLQPLYVIEEFQYTPMTVSILSFWFITLILKWSGFVFLGLLMLLISKYTSNTFIGYILSMGIIALLMIFKVKGTSDTGEIINLLNPISILISYKKFYCYETIKIFEIPVLKILLLGIASIISNALITLILYFTPLRLTFKLKGVGEDAAH